MELERTVGLRPDGAVWLPERAPPSAPSCSSSRRWASEIPAERRRRGRAPPGGRPVRPLPRADPAPVRAPLPRRPADPALPRRPAGRGGVRRARSGCRARRSSSIATASPASCPCRSTRDAWHNELVSSYRLDNGVLHNPVNDRRTTQGVFHVAEGGLPIPGGQDSRCRSAPTSGCCEEALRPPAELLRLPFTAHWAEPVETMVSLLLRPLVCPAVPRVLAGEAHGGAVLRARRPGLQPGLRREHLRQRRRSLPARATTPALDVDDWTGHSGCVILAPHLTRLRKKDLGLPHVSRGHRGRARRAACAGPTRASCTTTAGPSRSPRAASTGVMVTILADNYFGYCKKEVKTQISYSANLFGLAEEEHAGGALAFATFSLGDRFVPDAGADRERRATASRRCSRCSASAATCHAAGYATDAHLSRDPLHAGGHGDRRPAARTSPGPANGEEQHLKLLPGQHLHPPERLQDPHGQAPGGAELAPDRHGAGGHLLPQAVHRLGRRQVGDQQEPRRRRAAGVVLRAELRRGHGAGRRRSSTGTTTTRLPDRRAATRAPRAASCRPSARSAR